MRAQVGAAATVCAAFARAPPVQSDVGATAACLEVRFVPAGVIAVPGVTHETLLPAQAGLSTARCAA